MMNAVNFRRILSRQNDRLAAELELLGAGKRDLLSDPQHGVLNLLVERRRLVIADGAKSGSTNNLAIRGHVPVTGSVDNVNDPSAPCSDDVKNLRRRRASDPGPLVNFSSDGEFDAADLLVRGIARETLHELRQISVRILDLTVTYLKNAALDVIDNSVEEVKVVLSSTRL